MLPERFLDEVEKAEKLSKLWRGLALTLIFFTSFFLASPLLHEFSHIAALEAFGCNYSVDWSLSWTGLLASVQPYCSLNSFRQIFFYSAGYISMIIAGGVLSAVSIERDNSFIFNELSSVTASGILVSLILTLELRGDLTNILDILGLSTVYGELIYLLMVLGASSVLYLLVHNFVGQKGKAAARGML